MDPYLKRTWAQINLDAINNNFLCIKKHINNKSKIMCIVKADAYGHGATILAREYEQLGADFLGVSNLEEAIQIRKAGVKLPILILGYTPPRLACLLAKYKITQAIVSKQHAESLSDYAVKENINIDVHIKIDTGMSRIGLKATSDDNIKDSINTIKYVSTLEGLKIKGAFTHFAVSDEGNDGKKFTVLQYNRFSKVCDSVKSMGIDLPVCHCCNSGAVLDYPEFCMDMVRPGIILYGLYPSSKTSTKLNLQPAMELKTIVSMVKTIDSDTTISYGRTYKTDTKTKIATVPIGYADGYKRSLSSKAYMSVCGKKANVVGRICMDQTMLDVTHIDNIHEGDEVTVFGMDICNQITVDKLATISGTINYEFICLLGKRVPRIYYKNDKVVASLNYICPPNNKN